MTHDRALRQLASLGCSISVVLASACAQPTASTPPEPAVIEAGSALAPPAQEDPASVMASRIYTPDPDQKALQSTRAARFLRTDGRAVIGFCVDVHGQTLDLHVVEPFPGDPMVDEILMATISDWRFKPFLVDGRPTKTCTKRTFKLRFAGDEPQTATNAVPGEPLEPLPESLERDMCEHLLALTAAQIPERPAQAELEQLVRGCFETMRAARDKIGNAEFERKARCVLASESIEQASSTCN